MILLYNKNYSKKDDLIGLFRKIKRKFNPKKVLYPGSYIHITPSFIFPDVTYVDSLKKIDKFFESEDVKKLIKKNKEYRKKERFKFYNQDYSRKLPERLGSFDLVISLFGGFIGQAVKRYLKKGGILVCNDSHGDASMANLDKDYKLIAVYSSDDISEKNINEYFMPKKDIRITKKLLKKTMKGIKYTRSPFVYIFRKK